MDISPLHFKATFHFCNLAFLSHDLFQSQDQMASMVLNFNEIFIHISAVNIPFNDSRLIFLFLFLCFSLIDYYYYAIKILPSLICKNWVYSDFQLDNYLIFKQYMFEKFWKSSRFNSIIGIGEYFILQRLILYVWQLILKNSL